MPAEPGAWTLVVFARIPAAGQVKTRLIGSLGADGANDLHRRLVGSALQRAAAARDARVELWITGEPDADFIRQCRRHCRLSVFEQQGADLGQRMSHAIASVIARGASGTRCVLIGSDCPAQTPGDLEQAASALASNDVVLQPALDGGYVLIGMHRHHPALFDSISWGGAEVCAQTEAAAACGGLTLHRLRALPDLDTEADLQLAIDRGWLPR